ncbi:MAG: hypothetical protein K6T80_00970 [Firmicutes bacterium]|nr:hypothetical protein [Bacillota bacterium]
MVKFIMILLLTAMLLHINIIDGRSGLDRAVPAIPPPAEEPGGYMTDYNRITTVLERAVQDTSWLFAPSREELYRALSACYAGPLLEETARKAWEFRQKATDWPIESALEEYAIEIDGECAQADVLIKETDALSGEVRFERATFRMVKKQEGWRVVDVFHQ